MAYVLTYFCTWAVVSSIVFLFNLGPDKINKQ